MCEQMFDAKYLFLMINERLKFFWGGTNLENAAEKRGFSEQAGLQR